MQIFVDYLNFPCSRKPVGGGVRLRVNSVATDANSAKADWGEVKLNGKTSPL